MLWRVRQGGRGEEKMRLVRCLCPETDIWMSKCHFFFVCGAFVGFSENASLGSSKSLPCWSSLQCLAASDSHLAASHMSTWVESLSGKCKVDSLLQGVTSLLPLTVMLSPHSAGSSRSFERLNNFSCVLIPIPASSKLWKTCITLYYPPVSLPSGYIHCPWMWIHKIHLFRCTDFMELFPLKSAMFLQCGITSKRDGEWKSASSQIDAS